MFATIQDYKDANYPNNKDWGCVRLRQVGNYYSEMAMAAQEPSGWLVNTSEGDYWFWLGGWK